jgi:hypothetical protein
MKTILSFKALLYTSVVQKAKNRADMPFGAVLSHLKRHLGTFTTGFSGKPKPKTSYFGVESGSKSTSPTNPPRNSLFLLSLFSDAREYTS